jgi:KDO2-lipid IV(A) lauroyltransferase
MTTTEDRRADAGMGEQLSALAYGAAWRSVRWAPERLARGAFDRLADQLWQRRAGGVPMLEANLRQVVGPEPTADDLRVLSRRATRAYLQYWCDAFRLPSMSADDIRRRVKMHGFEHVEAADAAGHGAVLALPHSGNWDLIGAWLALEHGPFTTVAEQLRPRSLHEQFLQYRTSLGMEVLPLGGGARVLARLGQRLRDNTVVCLLADRDFGGHGVPVDLFGRATTMPGGPASLSLSTGAPLLPVEVWVDDAYIVHTTVHPPLTVADGGTRADRVAALTRELAGSFERIIAAHPHDWHMMQRIWADAAPAERSAA